MRRGWLAAGVLAAALGTGCSLGTLLDPPVLREYRSQTERLRALRFERRVRMEWIEKAQIPAIVGWELRDGYPPEYVAAYRDAYAALGLLPPDMDLLATLLRLNQDQLVGMYSVGRNTLYVRSDVPPDVAETPTILIHELVHALQTQHFPRIVDLMRALRRNDDVVLGVSSAIEGNASLTMLAANGETPGSRRDLASARRLREVMLLEVKYPSGVMAEVPRVLREGLIFPYAHGTIGSALAYERDGNRGLSAHLGDPPLSTLRVLDPRDRAPVEFIGLPVAALDRLLESRGCRRGFDNVAGVFALQVLFRKHIQAATDLEWTHQWSGDRFMHASCGPVPELAWVTRWRSPDAARVFAQRYATIADSVATIAPLAASPRVHVDGRSAIVLTPGLEPALTLLRDHIELRAYTRTGDWIADGCFPESPCPTP